MPEKKRRERRGRPPYIPTIEGRTSVERMKYCGESDETIARALKIDVDTLKKHFPDELRDGYANRRQEIIGLLFDAAQKGNASAAKRLDDIGKVIGADQAMKARETKTPAIGKKAEKQAAAEGVTGKFSPPSPPKLVVNNQS